MSGVTVGPHRDLESGDLVQDSTPLATGGSAAAPSPVNQILATDEQVKDVVVDLLTDDPDLSGIIPRINALEEGTDGLVNGDDPIHYYNLAKGA